MKIFIIIIVQKTNVWYNINIIFETYNFQKWEYILENNKLDTISNLFEGKEIRSIWDSEKEDYYFSVVDVIAALTDSKIPKRYWTDLKRKLNEEGSQLYENIVQLKMQSKKDGKNYITDTLDTKGILRLIESVPSR